jgi:hypothetical protein
MSDGPRRPRSSVHLALPFYPSPVTAWPKRWSWKVFDLFSLVWIR